MQLITSDTLALWLCYNDIEEMAFPSPSCYQLQRNSWLGVGLCGPAHLFSSLPMLWGLGGVVDLELEHAGTISVTS